MKQSGNQKFVAYEKLSKKARRELDLKQRSDWGAVRPATRIAENPKAYRRRKKHKPDFTDPDYL